jgi:hypothetical protein
MRCAVILADDLDFRTFAIPVLWKALMSILFQSAEQSDKREGARSFLQLQID